MQDLGNPLQGKVICQHVFGRTADGPGGLVPYLLLNVVQRVGGIDGKADQDDVGVGIGQGAEPVVILLASRIP